MQVGSGGGSDNFNEPLPPISNTPKQFAAWVKQLTKKRPSAKERKEFWKMTWEPNLSKVTSGKNKNKLSSTPKAWRALVAMYMPHMPVKYLLSTKAGKNTDFIDDLLTAITLYVPKTNTRTTDVYPKLRQMLDAHPSDKVDQSTVVLKMTVEEKVERTEEQQRSVIKRMERPVRISFEKLYGWMVDELIPLNINALSAGQHLWDIVTGIQLATGMRFGEVISGAKAEGLTDSQWHGVKIGWKMSDNDLKGSGIGDKVLAPQEVDIGRDRTMRFQVFKDAKEKKGAVARTRTVPLFIMTVDQVLERLRAVRLAIASRTDRKFDMSEDWVARYIKDKATEADKKKAARYLKLQDKGESATAFRQRMSNRWNGEMNRYLKRSFDEVKKPTSHMLRGIYANVMFKKYGGDQPLQLFLAKILGHKPNSLEAAKHYSTYKIVYGTPATAKQSLESQIASLSAKINHKRSVEDLERAQFERSHTYLLDSEGKQKAFKRHTRQLGSDTRKRLRDTVTQLEKAGVKPTWRNLKRLGYGSTAISSFKRQKQ